MVDPDSLTIPGTVPYERLLYHEGLLHIVYDEEPESPRYRKFVRDVTGVAQPTRMRQYSYLSFDHATTLHTSGFLYEPYTLTTYGYWTWERVADMVPRNYSP